MYGVGVEVRIKNIMYQICRGVKFIVAPLDMPKQL